MNRYEIALGKKPPPKKVIEPAIEPEVSYYLGLDIGIRRGQPTAIAVCHLSPGYEPSIIRTTIDYLEETPSTNTEHIINWLKGINCKWPIKRASVEQNYYAMKDSRSIVEYSGINFSVVSRITHTMENIYQSWVHGPEAPLRNINISRHHEDALKLCLWAMHEASYKAMDILRGYNPRLERIYEPEGTFARPALPPPPPPPFNQDTPYRNYTRDMQRQMSELNPDSPYRGQY